MAIQMLKEVEDEVTHFLSDLIRINTTNPPGNETKAAKYLAKNLSKEGLKCMTAIEVMTLKLLKRNNVKLKGDVILAATADEEQGGLSGADYLLRNYPEKIFADYVLNEGGGLAVPIRNKKVYTVQTAEKGILWFRVKAKGTPGHGSMPGVADNAIMRMGKVIEKLGNYRSEVLFVPTVKS